MTKKLLAFLMATLMTVLVFTGCGSSVDNNSANETFAGTLSEESYESETDAAKAFIENEIDCSSVSASYESAKKESTLKQEEIDKLDIDASEGTVDRVEKWTVSYSKTASDASDMSASFMSADATNMEKKYEQVTVYIVVFVVTPDSTSVAAVYEYKYYVPLPEVGETINASYYQSVLKAEKYENCTMTSSQVTEASGFKSTASYTMKITKDAVEMRVKTEAPMTQAQDLLIYIVEKDGYAKAVVKSGDEYVSYSLSSVGIYKLSDVYTSQLTEAECALFEKTNYGFKMNEDGLKELISGLLGQMGISTDDSMKAKSEYHVVDGRLDSVDTSLEVSVSMEGITVTVSSAVEIRYSDFGTTTVSIPEAAKEALGI